MQFFIKWTRGEKEKYPDLACIFEYSPNLNLQYTLQLSWHHDQNLLILFLNPLIHIPCTLCTVYSSTRDHQNMEYIGACITLQTSSTLSRGREWKTLQQMGSHICFCQVAFWLSYLFMYIFWTQQLSISIISLFNHSAHLI